MPGQAGKGLVAPMSTYTALVSRDGRFWHIEVPEINRVTQARNINEVDDMARDLASSRIPSNWTSESSSPTACEHTCRRSSGLEAPKQRRAPTQPPSFEPPPPNSRTPDYPFANSVQSSESPTSAPASSPAAATLPRKAAEPADPANEEDFRRATLGTLAVWSASNHASGRNVRFFRCYGKGGPAGVAQSSLSTSP
jgi:hypothetical protein